MRIKDGTFDEDEDVEVRSLLLCRLRIRMFNLTNIFNKKSNISVNYKSPSIRLSFTTYPQSKIFI